MKVLLRDRITSHYSIAYVTRDKAKEAAYAMIGSLCWQYP